MKHSRRLIWAFVARLRTHWIFQNIDREILDQPARIHRLIGTHGVHNMAERSFSCVKSLSHCHDILGDMRRYRRHYSLRSATNFLAECLTSVCTNVPRYLFEIGGHTARDSCDLVRVSATFLRKSFDNSSTLSRVFAGL